jgi:tetratricopeptide (TPR) repeat protein
MKLERDEKSNAPIIDRLNESKFYYEQGLAHWRDGNIDLAMSCLDECVKLGHPYFKAAALVSLGSLLSSIGDRENLLIYLRRIAELPEDESKFVPRIVMGRTLTALGEYDRAADAYRHAIQMKSKDPSLILNLAELELVRQRHDSAAELLSRLEDSPDPKVVLMASTLWIFLAALRRRENEIIPPLRKVLGVLRAHGLPMDFRWDFADVFPTLRKVTQPKVSYLVSRLISVLSREIDVQDFLNLFPQFAGEKKPVVVKV